MQPVGLVEHYLLGDVDRKRQITAFVDGGEAPVYPDRCVVVDATEHHGQPSALLLRGDGDLPFVPHWTAIVAEIVK